MSAALFGSPVDMSSSDTVSLSVGTHASVSETLSRKQPVHGRRTQAACVLLPVSRTGPPPTHVCRTIVTAPSLGRFGLESAQTSRAGSTAAFPTAASAASKISGAFVNSGSRSAGGENSVMSVASSSGTIELQARL